MTQDECQKQADLLFGRPMKLERVNGCCRISDTIDLGDGKTAEKWVGQGPSWKAALRYAAFPIAKAQRQREKQEYAEARQDAERFNAFLRDKFDDEFEAWKAQHFPPMPTAAPEEIAAPAPVQAAEEVTP